MAINDFFQLKTINFVKKNSFSFLLLFSKESDSIHALFVSMWNQPVI